MAFSPEGKSRLKPNVRAATTAAITLSGPQTIDTVSVVAGDRVLVQNQSPSTANGIYVCAAGAWSRSTDADQNADITSGLLVWVQEGAVNGSKLFVLQTLDPIVIGSSSLTFGVASGSDLSGSGATGQVAFWTGTNTFSGENALFWDATNNRLGINTTSPGYSLHVVGSTLITGNLIVQGTTTSISSETLRIGGNHVDLNAGYTAVSAQTGGLIVNYLPTSTATTVNGAYVAGVASVSNPTVGTTGAATFSTGDFVQVSGSTNNDDVYEVLSHAANVLTIRGIGLTAIVEDFTGNQFIAGASDGATITKVNLSVLRAGTDGFWEVSLGASTPLSFTDLGLASGVTGTGANTRLAYWDSASNLTSSANTTIVSDIIEITNPSGAFKVTDAGSAFIEMGAGYQYVTIEGAADNYATALSGWWSGTAYEVSASLLGYSPTATGSDAGIARAGSAQLEFYGKSTAVNAIHSYISQGLALTQGGIEIARVKSSEFVVNNPGAALVDFRAAGDTEPNLLFVDASTDRVGVGTNAPAARFDSQYAVNGANTLRVHNNNAGGSAYAELQVNNGSTSGSLYLTSTGYTPSGLIAANQAVIVSQATNGFLQYTSNAAAPLVFAQGGSATTNERLRLGQTESVFNESGSNIDFRIEGDNNANLLFIDASQDFVGIGTNTPSSRLTIVAAPTSSIPFVDASGTLFSSVNVEVGYRFTATSDGTAGDKFGGQFILVDGTTSTEQVAALAAYNQVTDNAGTATIGNFDGVFGMYADASVAGTGNRVGAAGYAAGGGTRNYGLIGRALAGTGATAVGVYGTASLSAGTPVRIGGAFTLYGSSDAVGTLVTAALLADNSSISAPIFVARHNGSTVFSVIDGGSVEMAEITAPATPATNFGRLYVKAKGGTNAIFYKDDAGTEFDLTATAAGTVTGTGSSGAVTFWNSSSSVTEDPTNFFWDDTNNRLGLGNNAPAQRLDVTGNITTSGFMEVAEIATPATPATGFGRIYAKADTKLYYLDEAGVEHDLIAGGGGGMSIGGTVTSGTAKSVLFINPAATLDEDTNFAYDTADTNLRVGTEAPSSTEMAFFRKDQNGNSAVVLKNATSNTAAQASLYLVHDVAGSKYASLNYTSTAFTPAGLNLADQAAFTSASSAAGGLLIAASGATAPVVIAQGGLNGNNERLRINSTESVFNDNGQNYDFRIEGDTEANLLFIDASTDRVGIGTNTPGSLVSILKTQNSNTDVNVQNASTGTAGRTNFGVSNSANQVSLGILSTGFSGTLGGTSVAANEAYLLGNASAALVIESTGAASHVRLGVFATEYMRVDTSKVRITGIPLEVPEIATPATPASGFGRIYGKTDNKLYYLNDAGSEVDLTAGAGAVTGTGTAGQVTFFNGTSTVTSNGNLTWDGTSFSALNILFGSGSAAAPSLALSASSTTGLYRVGANQLGISVAGAEAVRVDANAVRLTGIPLEVPEIAAPATPSAGFGRIYAKSDNLLYFKNDAGTEFDLTATGGMSIGGTVTSGTVGSLLFVGTGPVLAQDNANLFWDNTNNWLGIGTATPAVSLDVVGDANFQHTVNDVVVLVGTTATSKQALFSTYADTAYLNIATAGSTAAGSLWGVFSEANLNSIVGNIGDLVVGTDAASGFLALGSDGIERVKFGVGTTEVVFNDPGNNYDFRVEGDTDPNMLFVDASADKLGVKTSTPVSSLDVAGSFGLQVTSVSTNTTLSASHHTVLADATSGAITITLPAAASSARRRYEIKKIDSSANAVTVDANSSETIDGALTWPLVAQYNIVTIVCDGTAWYVL